jgi:peroxisomal membrane protein 2
VLSSHLAGVPAQRQPARDAPLYLHVLARTKVTMRAVKIGLYGLLVSGPLSHVLVGELQKAFAGKTGRASKLGQILASNLIISPIQAFCELLSFPLLKHWSMHFFLVYLFSLSVINGAKSWNDVKMALMDGFPPVMKVCFLLSRLYACQQGFTTCFRLSLSHRSCG